MKRAFKTACSVLEEMLDEDEDQDVDFFRWSSIAESTSAAGFLANAEISHDDVQRVSGFFDGVTESIEDMEAIGMQELVIEKEDELAEAKNSPECADFLPHIENVPAPIENEPALLQNVPVIEDKPPTLEKWPVAAGEALECNDDDLTMTWSDDVPAEYHGLSELDDMPVTCRIGLDSEQVVLEGLSVPKDLWSLKNGNGLQLANIFGPASL